MKKALKKEISQMLRTSIAITLNSVDEKAALKIKKTIEKATNRIAKKFGKKAKIKAQSGPKALNGKKKNLTPVESTTV